MEKKGINKPSYNNIILTDEEATEALRLAREMKAIETNRREYLMNLTRDPIYRQYSSQELFDLLKASRNPKGQQFIIDGYNEEPVIQICFYFANDQRFMGDLSKGLLLMGSLGTGKTHIMNFFQQNQHSSFVVTKTRTIENAWINESKDQDQKIIDYYSVNRTLALNENRFGHKTAGFCFDDLGSETVPSKRFGEEKNVMAEIIMNRYDNKLPYHDTHITTNLLPEEVENRYGSRVRDRLREMFNLITFEGKSRRV